jgi:hypothetical protein
VRLVTLASAAVKAERRPADIRHMIISDEQVQLALEYLHGHQAEPARIDTIDAHPGVSSELVDRVRRELAGIPETRGDRVATARQSIASGVSGDEVAAKMLGRMISDSIR